MFILMIFFLSFLLFQGHDNFGHTIPELIARNTNSTSNSIKPQFTLSNDHCTVPLPGLNAPSEMSPLPMHNRPVIGRKTAYGIDTLIIVASKLF